MLVVRRRFANFPVRLRPPPTAPPVGANWSADASPARRTVGRRSKSQSRASPKGPRQRRNARRRSSGPPRLERSRKTRKPERLTVAVSRGGIDADLVVVGAGPAGAAAALFAARRGHRGIILAKQAFPRDKPCGEGLMPGGRPPLRELGLEDVVLSDGAPSLA